MAFSSYETKRPYFYASILLNWKQQLLYITYNCYTATIGTSYITYSHFILNK